jgi:hypothetical protein
MRFSKRQKQMRYYFLGIVGLYIGVLIILLFFMPGLSLVGREVNDEIQLYVVNDSVHAIREIDVSTNQGHVLLQIPLMLPQEEIEIPLRGLKGYVIVQAHAPFHSTTFRAISLSGTQGVNVSYETAISPTTQIGFASPVHVSVCNTGRIDLEQVLVEELHEDEFFAETNTKKQFSLDIGECEAVQFTLTPEKAGRTEIYFNINALDLSESFVRVIDISEG